MWIVGGSLRPTATCELVAADHVVPLTRHAIGETVERLAPAAAVAAGRQYQLRVCSPSRQDIIGVWTVGEAMRAPRIVKCALRLQGLDLAVDVAIVGTAIVHAVVDGGGAAVALVSGEASVIAPRHHPAADRVTVRVLAVDGAADERSLTL